MTPVESFEIDEGTDQYGVHTRLIYQGDEVIKHTSQDCAPILEFAKEKRNATAGERWGEMRHVGFIPMAELATMMRQDGRIDKKRCIEFLKKNPALATFSKVLK